MVFDNPSVYILSIVMRTQNLIKIIQNVQEIEAVPLFSDLDLGIATTGDKCFLTIPLSDLVNSNVYVKFYQNIRKGSRDRASFTFSE